MLLGRNTTQRFRWAAARLIFIFFDSLLGAGILSANVALPDWE
jgi:hypothetical protein